MNIMFKNLLSRLQWLISRPTPGIPTGRLFLLAVEGVLLYTLVISAQLEGPGYQTKVKAAKTMLNGEYLLADAKARLGLPINPEFDPNRTGLIGVENSSITTDVGSLTFKQTVTNPYMAVVVTDMLLRLGIKEGDVVALGATGSYPSLNLATIVAVENLGADPITISSIGSSNWGANQPTFTWLDMEKVLYEQGIIQRRSLAASLGGADDRLAGKTSAGRRLATESISRNGIPIIAERTIARSIKKRLELYNSAAGGRPVKVFINIGGNVANLGLPADRGMLTTGIINAPTGPKPAMPGVAAEMLFNGIPVINLRQLQPLFREYDIQLSPVPFPEIGNGNAYRYRGYHTILAGVSLVVLLVSLVAAFKIK